MHKNVIQSLRSKRKRKDSEDADSGETDSAEHPEVDLYQLQVLFSFIATLEDCKAQLGVHHFLLMSLCSLGILHAGQWAF